MASVAVESGLSLRDLVLDEDARSPEMLRTVVNYLNWRAERAAKKRRR